MDVESVSVCSENSDFAFNLAKAVVHNLNEHLVCIDFIDAGSTSEVFLVQTNQSKYVLKIARPNPRKTAAYLSDSAIRLALAESGFPVAKAFATNHSMQINIDAEWALDSHCDGTHPERGLIPAPVSKCLGKLLRALHNLPVKKYGLLKNTSEGFRGQYANAIDGLLSRFESPWPYSSMALEEHPSVQLVPEILPKLLSLKEELMQFPMRGKASVVHGDLHEAQLLMNQNDLVALLDFNEAMVGRAEWDLGSYYYFHGKQCFYDLLAGYTSDSNTRSQLAKDALLAAILIALHHGNRGVILGKPHRIEASAWFLNESLH